MNNIKFSIITICYNSEATVERTIQSVLAQSYNNYEYIVIDGVSTDKTLSIVKKYEPLFEGRMKWISEPDNGIYDAMNKGVIASSGDILIISPSYKSILLSLRIIAFVLTANLLQILSKVSLFFT